MEIPVLIEPVAGNGYRAKPLDLSALCGEGATGEEALKKLKEEFDRNLPAGARIIPLDLAEPVSPWESQAGWLKDDPMLEAWKEAMAEYRTKKDQEPDPT